MKKNILFLALALSFTFIACSDDDKNDDPSLGYDYLCFTAQEAGSTVGIFEIVYDSEKDLERTFVDDTITSGPIHQDLEYSSDKKEWKKFNLETVVTLQSVGDKIYLRGNNPDGFNVTATDDYDDWTKYDLIQFKMTGKIAASGNIMTLIDRTGDAKTIPTKGTGCFMAMFYNCSALVTAPKLPATKMEKNCYCLMFTRCTSLKEAPQLPATELSPYCYSKMFYGCTALVTAPKLPAMKMAKRCYQAMFDECESLKEAPELPATELAEYCYGWMLWGCKSIEKAPVLPARQLKVGCYDSMFEECNKLRYVKALFEITDEEFCQPNKRGVPMYTGDWLINVAKEGTFVKSKNATWTLRGEHGVPDGWKIETE